MSAPEVDPQLESLLRRARSRAATPLTRHARRAELGGAVLVVAAIATLAAWLPGDRPAAPITALLLLAALVAASSVRFTLGAATGSPTEPMIVAACLLLPPAEAVSLVLLADIVARVPDYLRRRSHPDHLLLHFGDAWPTLALALVLGLGAAGAPSLGTWPIVLAAVAVQILVESVTLEGRAWLAHRVPPSVGLRSAVLSFAIDGALAPMGLLLALATATGSAAILLMLPLVGVLAALGREREKRLEHMLALSDAYRGTALLMGDMLELGDPYTGGEHSWGVVALVLEVGEALRLDPREQRRLEFAALLHDIGKLHVPREVLNKDGGLTDEEWAIIRRHPAEGQQMLERVGGMLGEIAPAVRAHHERWDGHGYPDGLRGTEIPYAARIIAACDALNAMTTTRPYRPAMPLADALRELRACAGRQFDPDVVDAIVELHRDPSEVRGAQVGTLALGRGAAAPVRRSSAFLTRS